jgi:hypothetical protein
MKSSNASIFVPMVFKAWAFSRQQNVPVAAGMFNPTLRSGRAGIDRASETVDLGADAATKQLESGDASQRDERCGNCVFRKFKTGFITQKSLNHFVAPFGVRLGLLLRVSRQGNAAL